METKFRLLLQEDLAKQLVQNSLATMVSDQTPEMQKKALQLGIAEVAAVVAIAVGLAKVAKTCVELADIIIKWKREHHRERLTILVEGAREDAVLEIDDRMGPAVLAERIQVTVTRE